MEPDPELPPDDEPPSRTARFAWVAVIVLLVGVIALVVYALTGTPATQAAVRRTPAPTALVASLGHVPQSVFDSVGVDAPDTPLVAPTPLEGQPPLQADGRPEVLYVGAEFCPFCAVATVAADRGAVPVRALHRARQHAVGPGVGVPGHPDLQLRGVDLHQPVPDLRAGRALLRPRPPPRGRSPASPTSTRPRRRWWPATARPPATRVGTGDLPFVDIANRMVATTSGYSPAVLERQSQATIATDIDHGTGRVGQAIVASANYLTAGSMHRHRPAAGIGVHQQGRAGRGHRARGAGLSSARPAVQELLALHLVQSAPDAVRLVDPHGVVEALDSAPSTPDRSTWPGPRAAASRPCARREPAERRSPPAVHDTTLSVASPSACSTCPTPPSRPFESSRERKYTQQRWETRGLTRISHLDSAGRANPGPPRPIRRPRSDHGAVPTRSDTTLH